MIGSSLEEDSFLYVSKVTKRFGRFEALHDVTFGARCGEFLCVLGPSGCGKTTLLRVIAGLETQDAGEVFIGGVDVSRLPTSKRRVGIVFQSYALFPNLSAFQNIAYGLKARKENRKNINERVAGLLNLVGLQGMDAKYPAQLSGGQQQRVALARAMALSPSLLLLDEPLSALDAKVRVMLREEIRRLQRELGVTALMVTHDREEALTMADRILVVDRGRVVQCGTPMEIYDKPASSFVASFIGSMNFLGDAVRESENVYRVGSVRIEVEDGAPPTLPGDRVTVAIRPEDIVVGSATGAGKNRLCARVCSLEFRGPHYRSTLRLHLGGEGNRSTIHADIPSEKIRRFGIKEDMDLYVQLPADRIHVYAA